MKKHRFITMIVLLSLLMVGCNQATPTPSPAPQAWIDSPLPGTYTFIGIYNLVFHAASYDGVSEFEVSINGNVEAVVQPQTTGPGGGGITLFYGALSWGFGAPGTYLIQVRAKSGGGVYGAPAQVEITITEELDLIEDLELPTPDVPEPPTPTPTPEPVDEGTGFGEPTFSEMELYYRGSCGPNQMTIEINATDLEAYSVVVFFRLADQTSSDQTEWTAMAMSPQGDGVFMLTLALEDDVPLFWSYLQAYLQLQFVATSQDGTEVGRSPVYSEVTVERCGL
jgi:hypothetical protein